MIRHNSKIIFLIRPTKNSCVTAIREKNQGRKPSFLRVLRQKRMSFASIIYDNVHRILATLLID